ncbi:hypothetical protein ACX27O_20095 [Micromonospora sp. SD19]|uniref:Uncharacterized protein n=1 Tax=Micromonospora parva TaxID=1464048 RepID=A0ABW6VPD0_9ACTN|nr:MULTISPECIES: hypothetical protein [Micromonospora]MBQ1028518.1 hypothetical protein [Micromonospora sp. C97]
MSAGLVAVLLGGGIPLVAALLLMIIGALGRRARAGRLTGRYTSRPGNSSDNSSSSMGGS